MELELMMLGAAALLLRIGFSMHASGSLRAKNGASAVFRDVADLCATTLLFWAVGAAILLQTGNAFFGVEGPMVFLRQSVRSGDVFFHLAVLLPAGAIVSGALAERARFYVGVAAAAVLAGLLMPTIGHWVWFGFLHSKGFIDSGGASVVHLPAAIFALLGALFVGPRMGKYNRDGSSNVIPGHSLPFSHVGAMLLLVGWFPYVIGCVLRHHSVLNSLDTAASLPAIAAMNIILAAAAGGAAAFVTGQLRYGKPDLYLVYSGLLGALVAICAGAENMNTLGAFVTGAGAGLVVPLVSFELDLRFRIDDPVGTISIHGVGAIWGIVAAALFSSNPWPGRGRLLVVQLMGLGMIVVASLVIGLILFLVLRLVGSLRVNEQDEYDGLDLGELDINAYPDFQQTMIKSYHLREA